MLEQTPGLAIAFMTGLLGSVHCIGMCGGILAALGLRHASAVTSQALPKILAYNLGRISSYALAGAIAGGLGAGLLSLSIFASWQQAGRLVAGLITIGLGLYIWGWTPALALLERIGGWIWRRLQPFATGLNATESWSGALLAGMIWGWLPCGMVYAILTWALGAGGAGQGALLLAVFGLGTLPTMLVLGSSAVTLQKLMAGPLRKVSGVIIVFYGVYLLAAVFFLPGMESGHSHHHH